MASSKTILVIYLFAILIAKNRVNAIIGVNWGRQSAQRLIPSTVVDLMLQNGVKEARIYTSREDLLKAFAGTGIGLTLSTTDLKVLESYQECADWVRLKSIYFNTSSVRRIYVGNVPFLEGLTNKPALNKVLAAVENLQRALNDAGYGGIKVTYTHFNDELKRNITKPSEAEFRDEIKEEMAASLRFLQRNDAPFAIDIVPSFFQHTYNMDPLFAFVGESDHVVKDLNGAVYTNAVEFLHDAFVWALRKLNVTDMRIIISQIGWPTDGYNKGNNTVTERFFKGLLPYVASDKGTPLRPGAPIDTFVHSFADENKLPDGFMRHWGIYRSNGKPKFKIDLTGQGRDIYPSSAKGIERMPERWCVFNGNRTDYPKVMQQLAMACNNSDCSSLQPGGQCSHVSFNTNVSFAFNMYFQFQFQDEKACIFEGLSSITVEDPSTSDCEFPVEVVKGQQEGYVSAAFIKPGQSTGLHHRLNGVVPLFLLSILGALFWS